MAPFTTMKQDIPTSGYRLVDRSRSQYNDSLDIVEMNIAGVKLRNNTPLVIAGPCTVHSREQTLELADAVKAAGADMFRGGAFKPRTSPYAFKGLEKEGLRILAEARERTGLPIVTEVMDTRLVEVVGEYTDVFQIGSRNMQNYPLLSEVGKYAAAHDKGVLLKTSLLPTLQEVLCAAEYLAVEGAEKIILCERGMAFSQGTTRNTPNFMLLRELRSMTHLPIIGDPSHSTGQRDLVLPTSDMYLASGANGLIIEVIRDDEKPTINGVGVCDYNQGLRVGQLQGYIDKIRG